MTPRTRFWVSDVLFGHWELVARIQFSRRGEPVVEDVLEIRRQEVAR
jgi:hypothetical protein